MPGFLISNFIETSQLINNYPEYCVYEELEVLGYRICRNTLKKFMDDKLFSQDNELVLITEGVILNKSELIEKYHQKTFFLTVKKMIALKGKKFFSDFRGSFCGAVYDKITKEWIVYTNQVGDHPIFYYNCGEKFIVATQVNYILDTLKLNRKHITLDKKAVYDMLTFAFMEQNNTYAKEIKRLAAGSYIEISNGQMNINSYHKFDREKYGLKNLNERELIEKIDEKFRKAVELEYEKDLEYGYKFYTDLSGGLDSRMTMWVGSCMGYLPMTHLTYCQANYKDELIAKKLADYWNNEIIVKSLNDALFMQDIDKIISMNAGLSLYSGITGGMRLLEMLNTQKMGLEHTGQLGDAVLGSFYKKQEQILKWNLTGMYSERLRDKISEEYKHIFADNELYLLYTRGFQGAACTHLIRQNYTEVSSPFMDVDFLELCYSIPAELRINHNIYIKWILEKYPEAAGFIWEKTGCKLTAGKLEKFLKKLRIAGPIKIRNMLKIPAAISDKGMNPMDYWYMTNPELRKYMDHYFEDNVRNEMLDFEMRECLKKYYQEGTVLEKTQALTAIGAVRYYFA